MTNEAKEQAVRALTQQWLEATVRADTDFLDAILEPGYTFTHATTAITDTREEWLDSFRSGRRRYKLWEISDITVQLYPGVAVMHGRGHQEIPRDEGMFDLRTSFSSVWINHEDAWKCAIWQATLVP
jgi:ketosteroid isomerase-like protein